MKNYYVLINYKFGAKEPPIIYQVPFGESTRELKQLKYCLDTSTMIGDLYFHVRDHQSAQIAMAISQIPRAINAQITPTDAVAIIKTCYRSYVINPSLYYKPYRV